MSSRVRRSSRTGLTDPDHLRFPPIEEFIASGYRAVNEKDGVRVGYRLMERESRGRFDAEETAAVAPRPIQAAAGAAESFFEEQLGIVYRHLSHSLRDPRTPLQRQIAVLAEHICGPAPFKADSKVRMLYLNRCRKVISPSSFFC